MNIADSALVLVEAAMGKLSGVAMIIICFLSSRGVHNIGSELNSPDIPSWNPSGASSFLPTDKSRRSYLISRTVDLVILHASVLDKEGKSILDLKQGDFRIFENQEEQKIATFACEDIPVSIGLVIDNSASMLAKRPRVNAAAQAFVQAGNPHDEMFVVNFSIAYHLDRDFTSDFDQLYKSIERVEPRGSTALYDAVLGSLDHLSNGTCDKKALLLITDGEDNSSLKDLAYTLRAAQQSEALIYAIGLFAGDNREEQQRAARSLKLLAESTGGEAFFPKKIGEIRKLCRRIAGEIRNQYTLTYYPSNTEHDGTYRRVQVMVGSRHFVVRARPGYYARNAVPSQ